MNVLEEFWYGNLDPAEYDANPGKEYKELVRLISRNEEKLLATMTDEQKDLFSRYTDCVREHQAMAECLLFQNSFRLAGRMMLEVLRGGMQSIINPPLQNRKICAILLLSVLLDRYFLCKYPTFSNSPLCSHFDQSQKILQLILRKKTTEQEKRL